MHAIGVVVKRYLKCLMTATKALTASRPDGLTRTVVGQYADHDIDGSSHDPDTISGTSNAPANSASR